LVVIKLIYNYRAEREKFITQMNLMIPKLVTMRYTHDLSLIGKN